MSNGTHFQIYRYNLMTVDPVHIGTGGSRLGRVDNSIIREPGTKLPKIPGTSLSGAIRQNAAYRNGNRDCAGQKDHHTNPDDGCPVCYTFGVANEAGGGFRGVVSIGDSRLLLFPVYSMSGPVWVTSAATLADTGVAFGESEPQDTNAYFASGISGDHINLGWVMVSKAADLHLEGLPTELPDFVPPRIVLVSEKLFSQVVNSGLEVRTSVSINPETGAAEEGALFTHESIPRSTFLWMDIVEDDFRGQFPTSNDQGWEQPIQVVDAGLAWAEHLGVGGMGTRGFGRFRSINRTEVGS